MAIHRSDQFWKTNNRLKHAHFKSAETLLAAAYDYFDWCDKHTWYKREILKSGPGQGCIVSIPVVRPYSLDGLCVHLGCSRRYFNKFKQTCDEEFAEVIGRIETIVETQHFEGSTVGMFKAFALEKSIAGQAHQDGASGRGIPLKIEVIDADTKKELENLPEILKK